VVSKNLGGENLEKEKIIEVLKNQGELYYFPISGYCKLYNRTGKYNEITINDFYQVKDELILSKVSNNTFIGDKYIYSN
jgi:hypothetical protein